MQIDATCSQPTKAFQYELVASQRGEEYDRMWGEQRGARCVGSGAFNIEITITI